jgi:hypothetical protein
MSTYSSDADTSTRGHPLPPDAVQRWDGVLRRLWHDPGTPEIVRRAASHINGYWAR